MTPYLIGAAVAAVAAGFFFWQSREEEAKKARLLGVETTTTGQLAVLVQAAADAAGPGAFAQPVELTGEVVEDAGGPLTAPLSDTSCVWHQHVVTRKYRHTTRDSEGRTRSTTREEQISNTSSNQAFALRDAEGSVVLVPSHGVDGARKSVDRWEDDADDARTELTVGSFSMSLPSSRGGDRTLGYRYEEYVLTAGTRVFVQGEASDQGGRLEVRGSGGHPMVITTRSETQLIEEAGGGARTNRLLSIGAGVLAVVLLVVGIVVGLV